MINQQLRKVRGNKVVDILPALKGGDSRILACEVQTFVCLTSTLLLENALTSWIAPTGRFHKLGLVLEWGKPQHGSTSNIQEWFSSFRLSRRAREGGSISSISVDTTLGTGLSSPIPALAACKAAGSDRYGTFKVLLSILPIRTPYLK